MILVSRIIREDLFIFELFMRLLASARTLTLFFSTYTQPGQRVKDKTVTSKPAIMLNSKFLFHSVAKPCWWATKNLKRQAKMKKGDQ